MGEEDFQEVIKATGEPLLYSMKGVEHTTKDFMDFPKTGITAYQLWQVHKRRLALRKAYLDHWEATAKKTSSGRPYDAIIAPVAPWASTIHGENLYVLYEHPVSQR